MRTPISATGAERGFTLVELLVVVVIIGLMGAAVVLAIPDPQGSVRDETERFAARLIAARDSAIVNGRDVAVRFDAGGYGFETRRSGAWTPAAERAFRPQRWTEGLSLATDPVNATHVVFDATGLATPTVLVLTREGASMRVKVEAGGAVRVDAG